MSSDDRPPVLPAESGRQGRGGKDHQAESLLPPTLRPMEIGELLDEAFDLYKRDFLLLCGIAALLNVPIGVLVAAAPKDGAWQVGVNVLNTIGSLVTTCALTYAAYERLLGRKTTISASYRFGCGRSLRLFSGYIVLSLVFLGGLLLFVIPGLVVMLWSLLLPAVVVVENQGGRKAMERCRRLASGNLWRLFILGLALWFVILLLLGVLAGLSGLAVVLTGSNGTPAPAGSDTTEQMAQALAIVVYTLCLSAWTPVLAIAQLMTYLDLRIRREAYDLELLTTAVEARAETAPRAVAAAASPPGPAG